MVLLFPVTSGSVRRRGLNAPADYGGHRTSQMRNETADIEDERPGAQC